ncbi:hypothetical protein C4573_03520 [Candidatus Woesearchaeota archaeon]|nr:MAG: hypothetical protein C4573_03520 [Candidatus Woesearchaeota archaeon]
MVSITFPLEEAIVQRIEQFPWVNWSAIAREELKKKAIFEKYLKTKKISDADWLFCEQIDWHPVDELPLKKDYLKKLEKRYQNTKKMKSVDELFKQ